MPNDTERLIQTGFALLGQRIEDQCDRAEERHTEVLRRFAVLDADMKAEQGRGHKNDVKLVEHSEQIKTLFKRLRERAGGAASSGKKWYVGVGFGIGAGVVWALFKVL